MNLTEKEILEKLEIIIDTREKSERLSEHIISYLKKKKVRYMFRKLDFGDYSMNYEGESFENKFAIERKASLKELAGNFTNGRERFEREFERAKEKNATMLLMIENASFGGLLAKTYDTKFEVKAFYASLLSWRIRYDFMIDFVHENQSGLHILYNCYYYIRNYLKKEDLI